MSATACACGKPIHMTDGVWRHSATGAVDCYRAALYVGFVARPAVAA